MPTGTAPADVSTAASLQTIAAGPTVTPTTTPTTRPTPDPGQSPGTETDPPAGSEWTSEFPGLLCPGRS